MSLGRIIYLFSLFSTVGGCWPGTFGSWHAWGSCSRSCGGGTRSRVKYSCVRSDEKWQHEKCNEFCYNRGSYYGGNCHCNRWRSGTCCEDCVNIDIPHCKTGRQQCGGSPDNIKCTECSNPYYSAGWGNGCHECPNIAQCVDRHCTTRTNTRCEKCQNNGILFKPTPDKKKCERVCAWDKQNCWPGHCDDDLTRKCYCAQGFHKYSGPGETSCQLDEDNAPSVSKCFTSVFGPGGKGQQTKSPKCKEVKDFYGNFQPRQLQYDVTADFRIDVSNISMKAFIKESKFGVTDFTLYIAKELISGTHHDILKKNVLKDISNGMNAVEEYYKKDTVDLNVMLNDGERLCVKYEAYGGGYLTTIDISGKHEEKGPYPYRKTNDSQTFCYRYDKSKPYHCLVTKNCSVGMSEPLRISNVISRSRTVTVEFNGWTDPVPVLGKAEHASGIESYLITVHGVSGGIPDISPKITKALNFSQTTLTLTLPPDSPMLYCIKLEVKDVAENTQQARRFVLYDNSTFISANAGNASFSVTSATGTNKWQTNHGDICLSWKSYFTNTKYKQNSFLEPIVSDNLISTVYDQTTGSLSVSGTKNVFGIVKYLFSWSLNNGALSKERRVPDFTSQTYCQHFNMKDGQTYTLKIRAVDIVNNTYSENRTVYIDRTPPHIQNIGLMKNGMRQLFVHGNTDLSKLNFSFEALDLHSGLLNIQWWIGTSDSGSELGHGIRSAQKISQDGCPKNMQNCYCPDVGQCEGYGYNISMNGLADNNTSMGNHNRNYFFTIKVTNNAGLSNTEHVDILVDDSPPEHGVIYEGAKGTSDIDYTSDGSFIVRWHGFIDHESGIKEYRLGLANTCVGKEELENYHGSSNITQYAKLPSTESSFRMTANFTGKKYVNIIAINNAMEASDIVCSDGITRDDTPPVLENLRIQHGTWYESLYCRDGEAWLFKSDLMKVRLPNISECNLRCKADTPGFDIYEILPVRDQTPSDETFGEFMCRKLPMYDLGTIIYLPNDRISLSWEIEETGSQIEDFFVSFGLSSGNVSAPSIMNYKSTNRKMFFKMRHLGVGTGDLFYAYIKTVNKAKLAKVTEIGPILIDETPPYFNGKPVVLIDNHMVTVGWNKNTVYDPEQAMQINQMFFQIVHDAQVVSPFLEWRLEDSWPCVNYTGGCITYPVEKLQKLDTDLGLNFTILVYAYNNAGHFATMKTDTFKVPSLYPPGQAVVNDIDPEGNSSKSSRDTDVHFTANTLCAQWTGFRHHENVKLEIGVGTNNLTADLVQLHPTNASNRACIKSKALQYNTKYFVLLRASCSGGETVSSSNGISIVNETHFLLNFEIQVGVYSEEIRLTRAALNSSQTTFCVSKTVKIGQKYKLMIKGVERNISGTTNDHTVLYEIRFDNNSKNIEVNMIPLIERPCITLDIDSSCNATAVMYRRTDNGTTIIPDSNAISVAWAYRRYKEILKHLTFEISLGEREKLNSSQLSSITDVSKSYGFASHTFHDFSLLQGHVYAAIVKPCTNFRCIGPVYSDNFEIESTITPGKMLTFQVELNNKKTCVDVTLSWKMFEAKSSVTLYQWSLSKDKEANIVLTRWRTVACDGRVLYNVSECVNLPVLGHATIYLCVRAFSAAGNTVTSCKRASLIQTSEISRDILYDIDASVHSWNDIKKVWGLLTKQRVEMNTDSAQDKILEVIWKPDT